MRFGICWRYMMRRKIWAGELRLRAVVSGFSHSFEVNAICADVDRPYVFIFVEKDSLECAAEEYIERKSLGDDDASDLRVWLKEMSGEGSVGILESSR